MRLRTRLLTNCFRSEAKRPQYHNARPQLQALEQRITPSFSNGMDLRIYRLAIASTSEFTSLNGGKAGTATAISSIVNAVNTVYNRELSVNFVLVNNNNDVIFNDPNSNDDYTSGNRDLLVEQNQAKLDSVIKSANYDIGIVLDSAADAGLGIGQVGNDKTKGKGCYITSKDPVDSAGNVDFDFLHQVCHEVGHMFTAGHTFSGLAPSGNGLNSEYSAPNAFEPGTGSTMMSYAQWKESNNNNFSDVYSNFFHIRSLDTITDFIKYTIPTVGTKMPTYNNVPTVTTNSGYYIPANTPFELSGSGYDPNGALTFTWEQYDKANTQTILGSPDPGSGPLYRSFEPTPTGNVRSIPELKTVLAGQTGSKTEVAVTTTRDLHFRLTARDGLGAYDSSDVVLHVVNTGSLGFAITNFFTPTSVYAGTKQTVSWSVAGTTANSINATSVIIDLSTDGGHSFAYPITVPNNGLAEYTLPTGLSATTQARFRIRPTNNIFYDISNADFTIKAMPSFVVTYPGDSVGDNLRKVIQDAKDYPGIQTITFDPSYFNVPRTITLTGGELTIDEPMVINGPGAGLLTISGNNNGRIFNTDAAPANASITIRGVTITAGKGADGGAINVGDEALTIEDCVISGNSASEVGGAINVQLTGSLTLRRSTITGNTAADDGGGIYMNLGGTSYILDCAIVNNNASTGIGGGLYFYGGSPTIVSSTIANNTAAAGGGGIVLTTFNGSLNIVNSTITANTTTGSIGGGISRVSGSGQINLTSSVVSGNSGSNPEISSAGTVNAIYSAIGSTVGFNLSGSKNIVAQNLKLRPLANNGGPTLTVAFESDSPLRGAGLGNPFFPTDQRGQPRDNDGVDIGAFELQTTVLNTSNIGVGSLRAAVDESNRVVGTDTIDFSSTFNTPQTIALTAVIPGLIGGELILSEAATISGPGSGLLTIGGSNLSRILNIIAVPTGKTVTLRGLTLTAGYSLVGPPGSGFGGAVVVDDEYLVVDNCTLTKNSATVGGAIYVGPNGKLSLTLSTLSSNFAAGGGGAIWFTNGGNSEIIASSLVGNTAVVGGAIYLNGQGSSVTVLNSTLSGNSATNGGGVALDTFIGALTIRNTTITGNTAGARGGGLDSLNGSPNINIESTIVSGNTGATGPDISSTSTVTVNKSAIGSAAGFTLTGATNLAFGANLKLGALAQNGGPTLTHLPAGDSPVVNAGSNPATVTYDQRGIARTLLGGTDIGSVELTNVPDNTAPTITLITSPTPNNSYTAGAAITIEVNFSETVTLNGTLAIALDSGGVAYVYGPFTGDKFSGTYTVAAGQASSDLNVTALTLPGGGTLRDAALNPASLTLPVGNNLANNKAIVVVNNSGGDGTVTNLLDSGPGSLRAAIDKANSVPGANNILFDPNLTGTITLTSQLNITDAVQILGPAAAPVTISGNNAVRVFNTYNAPANAVINFSRLTIANGKASYGAGLQMGDEVVLFDRCVLTNNAANVCGGAIWMDAGSLTLQNSTISNNKAPGSSGFGGGGVYANNGAVTILNCTISGNSVTGSGNAGGGLFVRSSNGAGALIRNSTFTGNSAPIGGGIASYFGNPATLDVQNSTITGNSANSGGGIDNNYFGTVQLASSIVFGNVAPTGPDLRMPNVNATASLVGSKAGTTNFTGDTFTNANIGVNPLLGPLNNNGGPTLTHGFLAGSPALNNGTNPFSEPYDQRGIGFPRVLGGKADIGAVEGAVTIPSLVVSNADDSGAGSLRQAIINANNQPGADTVTFDSAFFSTPRTIALTSAEIAISEALTITGPGALLATVSGGNARRLFNTSTAPAGAAITLSGLTLAGGNAGLGGALYAEDESIAIAASTISGNSALSGGGIAVSYGGTLTLTQSTVSGNTASLFGGGVYLNYSATSGASGNVVSSSLVGNTAGQSGGGMFVLGNAGPGGLRFTNSTVSGNSANGKGGGIALLRLNNSFQVLNSTITNNASGTGAFGGGGGGISLAEGNGAITVESSIVSGNNSAEGGFDISSPSLVNVNFSAIGSNAGFTLTGGNNLPFGANLKLGALAANGGPTLTHALLFGSPAINAGSNSASLTTDQRGSGFQRSVGQTDIGALESNFPPTVTSVVFGDGTNQRSLVKQIVVTFSEAVNFSPSVASAFTLTRTGTGGTTGNVTLTANPASGPASSVTITFSGSLTEFGSLIDGLYDFTVSAAQVSGNGGALDGNADGIAGGSYIVTGTTANKFFRFFGDSNGDAAVDQAVDLVAFRNAFGLPSPIFDFNDNGVVDQTADFVKFRNNFGLTP